jgi:uncharacterized protein (DUF849 family)
LIKTVLTAAITGAGTKPEDTPHLPITPEQIATSALECAEAGAAVVHIHVRDPETGQPAIALDLYEDTVDRIRKQNTDVIINLTTGPGAYWIPSKENLSQGGPGTVLLQPDIRVRHIEKIKPDICSIDFNTMHQAGDGIRINHRRITQEMVCRVQAVGCKPELEIFDSGDFRIAQEFVTEGIIESPPLWQFAMGIKYGWAATPEALDYARRQLSAGSVWSAFGISKMQMPIVAQSWIYGGHVRVGLEDNIYLEKGVLAKTNAELVHKAVRVIKDLGGQIANYQEAREIFNLYQR